MTKLNIKIYRNLMGANDQWAERTRALRKKHRVIMLNLIGSPGTIRTCRAFALEYLHMPVSIVLN